MKKWLILLLLVFSQMSLCVFAESTIVNGIEWYYTLIDGNATDISPNPNDDIQGYLTIPSTLDGHPVTSIGHRAFSGIYTLTGITIPQGVKSIGNNAFLICTNLEYVAIADSVSDIGDWAFERCYRLSSVTIPNSVTNIGKAAFQFCTNLTRVSILNGVQNIGPWAFYGCSSLSNIIIPNSVTNIGRAAFADCSGLKDINIGKSVMTIGESAFEGCDSLVSLSIPGSVKDFGKYAFMSCDSLKRVTLEHGVEVIGESAFYNCVNLLSISIPSSVTNINYCAFYSCGLTSVTIPGSVLHIGELSFALCNSLSSVVIQKGVLEIGNDAFRQCESLTRVSIADSVTRIGNSAFSVCSLLGNISIPESVTDIGISAFDNTIFESNLPVGLVILGKVAYKVNGSCPEHLIIPDGVVSFSDGFGAYCSDLVSISIPDSLAYIGNDAFNHCTGLTNLIIPDNVRTIGNGAFAQCTAITNVVFGENLESVGKQVFDGCQKITMTFLGHKPNGFVNIYKKRDKIYCRRKYATEYELKDGFVYPNLSDWISDTDLMFACGDMAEWIGDTDISHDGYESLRSGIINDNESSWIETTISGQGRISFWWKASCEEYGGDVYDYGYMSVDGVPQGTLNDYRLEGIAIGGQTDWTNIVLDVVGEGTHTIRWTYRKDETNDTTSVIGEDCIWLDEVSFLPKPTISFSIGADASGDAPDSIQDFRDTNITLPSGEGFYWTDHVFNCWTDGANDYSGGANYTIPSSNVTLTAKWIAKSFVSFDIGEGTGETPETIKDVPNAIVTLPMADGLEWTDHVFNSWSDGHSVYLAGADYIVPSSNVTLTARWIAKSFVSFDIGGGMGEAPQTIKALPNERIALPTGDGLTMADYAFGGWSDGARNYAAGGYYTVPSANVTLTAIWVAKRFLTFTLDGGEGEIPITIKDIPNATVTLPSGEGLSKPKYTFVGWSDGAQTYAAGAEYVVTDSSVEFTAVWEANLLDAPVIISADVANDGTIETANATIEISADSGAAIYYTIDGTEPTTNSIPYIVPFTADGLSVTIKAFAVKDDYFDSSIAAFSFSRKPYSAAECINVNGKTVSTGGNDMAWWRVLGDAAHDGVAALRSGEIGDGESSSIEMTVDGAGEISFWWKSSSEISRNRKFDYVSFLIDDVEHSWLGGEKGWTNEVHAVSGEGTHTLKWIYQKNNNGLTQGEDCAWLDEVKWTPWREITTKQTAVPIPYGWLDSHGLLANTDAETAAKQPTGKRDGSGRFLTVEDDFISGTDPTDSNDLFTISITISNGVPVIAWQPNLNTNGDNRVYTIYGKESLGDEEWMTPTNSLCRFFKVGVAMPTVEENHDTTGGDNGGDEGGNESGGGSGTDGNGEDDNGGETPPETVKWSNERHLTDGDGEMSARNFVINESIIRINPNGRILLSILGPGTLSFKARGSRDGFFYLWDGGSIGSYICNTTEFEDYTLTLNGGADEWHTVFWATYNSSSVWGDVKDITWNGTSIPLPE